MTDQEPSSGASRNRQFDRVLFSGHAVRRMFRRGLTSEHVLNVIRHGEVIADYPDDTPYPSRLLLGYAESRPVHVVLAVDRETRTAIVVTAYEPDAQIWDEDFRNRRQP